MVSAYLAPHGQLHLKLKRWGILAPANPREHRRRPTNPLHDDVYWSRLASRREFSEGTCKGECQPVSLEQFISSAWFRYGIFPLVSALAGILLKCAARNDQYAFFKKEDMAVGPQLMLTAALTFVVVSTDRAHALVVANAALKSALNSATIDRTELTALQGDAANLSQKLMGSAWLLLALVLLLWGVTTIVKRWGWKTESELYPFLGIGLPLALGVLSLVTVMTVVQP